MGSRCGEDKHQFRSPCTLRRARGDRNSATSCGNSAVPRDDSPTARAAVRRISRATSSDVDVLTSVYLCKIAGETAKRILTIVSLPCNLHVRDRVT